MRKVLIVGATSAIAEATARRLAERGERLFLIARNGARLAAIAADLRTRGAVAVGEAVADLNDMARHAELIGQARAAMGGLDTILIAHGNLSDQKACERSVEATMRDLQTNFLSAVSLLTHIANDFEAQGHGCIAVISSVAGDRGRMSNYVYGTAKGALTIFMQGLRQRLHRAGVQVLTIKPGFVDTPMTRDFKKGLLWVGPDRIARGIVGAIDGNKSVVYLPGFWRGIMAGIGAIPERVFCRLSL